ncbi:MAG: lipopolysaccharide transport periplasmic protein LptA [Gammaproteobacteria bacterium]|nr:lipopolysaccharide transport periplasmic protein LptA [Gammaproteobacteria bacterium]
MAEKIFISADHMQMNINSGNSVYTGNVKVSQGELKLSGDKVILKNYKDELEQLIITGKPARYNHVSANGENVKAESEHIVYAASKNKLILTTNAKLVQPDHKLSSQKIIYDTLNKTIIAGDENAKKTQRVNIILTPKKSSSEK